VVVLLLVCVCAWLLGKFCPFTIFILVVVTDGAWGGCEVCQFPEFNNETGSSPCAEIHCGFGMEASTDATCVPCAQGYYSDTNESGQCKPKSQDCAAAGMAEVASSQAVTDAMCCPADDAACKVGALAQCAGAIENAFRTFAGDAEAQLGALERRAEELEESDTSAAFF